MEHLNYDLCAFIGRFQLLHEGQVSVIRKALEKASKVAILIGSSNQPRSVRNPFTFEERKQMILDTFPEDVDRLIIRPLNDYRYNDTKWVEQVQRIIADISETIKFESLVHGPKVSVALIGHNKDETSYYLKLFPQWDSIAVENYLGFSATPMRTVFFSNIGHQWLKNADGHHVGDKTIEQLIPTPVKMFLENFIKTDDYKYVVTEHEFVQKYKLQWSFKLPEGIVQNIETAIRQINETAAEWENKSSLTGILTKLEKQLYDMQDKPFPPYPIQFQTVDCIIEASGHILLVTRKAAPGQGLLALPGGFVNENETLKDAAFRELKEETKIKVPMSVLKGSIINERMFDDPKRSDRGRTFTYAYHVKLNDDVDLPVVKGGDDALYAKFYPIAEITGDKMFEDHYEILKYFIN